MVVHERHGQRGVFLHERVVEQRPHVEVEALLRCREKFEVKRRVEQVDLVVYGVEVGLQRLEIAAPVLTDGVELFAPRSPDVVHEVGDEGILDVFERVEAHAVRVERLGDPYAPAFHFFGHFGMVEVHVVEDQEIVVPVLAVDAFAPLLAFALDEVDGPFAGLVNLVGSREVVPVPFEGRIFVAASRKGVSRPPLDFDGRADHLLAVLGIDLAGHEFLGIVGAGLLVHHRVEVDGYPVFVERRDRFFQFVPRAVLGADSPFLVELPQIVQVVHGVSLVLLFVGLVGRRYPDRRDADVVQVFGILFQVHP